MDIVFNMKNMDLKESLRLSMKDMGLALFLTSLTTAIGFLALLYSSISIVQEFGVFIACGVFLAYVLTLTFIPAMLILLKDRIHIKTLRKAKTDSIDIYFFNFIIIHWYRICLYGKLFTIRLTSPKWFIHRLKKC